MNKYANGGFVARSEHVQVRPRTLETFLTLFKRFIYESLAVGGETDM